MVIFGELMSVGAFDQGSFGPYTAQTLVLIYELTGIQPDYF